MTFLSDLWDGMNKPVHKTGKNKGSAITRNQTGKGPVVKRSPTQGGSYRKDSGNKSYEPPVGISKPKSSGSGAFFNKATSQAAIRPASANRKLPTQPNIRQAQRNDDPMAGLMPEPTMAEDEGFVDPLDELLGGIQDFVPPEQDNSGMEAQRASIMAALDEMLGGQLAGLNNARGQVQGNFNTSDANLKGMHDAFQNDIATKGAEAYRGITSELTGNLTAGRDSSVGALQALEAKDTAEQSAMLRNLGIQEAAPGLKSAVYDEGSANIIGRTATDLTSASQQGANNQTFNQGLATTTGMQGTQRRAALAQQMQSLMGDISEKEVDVRSDYQNARAKAESELASAGMEGNAAAQDAAWKQYQYEQSRLDDRIGQMQDQNFEREKWDFNANQSANELAAKSASTPQPGFAGLTQDLANNYGPEMATKVTQALAEVYSGSELESRTDSDVRRDPIALAVNALVKRGIPKSVALHGVTNYNQLGTTSKFAPQ